jgi:choline-glycine betaine transporter
MKVLMWYFIGVVLGYILLIVGNTMSVKCGEEKAKLKYIFYSWSSCILWSISIAEMLVKYHKPFAKITKFFNQEPDLTNKK